MFCTIYRTSVYSYGNFRPRKKRLRSPRTYLAEWFNYYPLTKNCFGYFFFFKKHNLLSKPSHYEIGSHVTAVPLPRVSMSFLEKFIIVRLSLIETSLEKYNIRNLSMSQLDRHTPNQVLLSILFFSYPI